MSHNAVFIDTSALIALSHHADGLHASTVQCMGSLIERGHRFVTSDLVIVEFLNASSAVRRRMPAAALVRDLLVDPALTIVHVSHPSLLAALKFFETRPDKEWSIVDCSSLLICEAQKIELVLTRDRHFQQAGLQILL